MARTSGAVGGIAARVAGAAHVRHQDRSHGACRGPAHHPGRAEGPADEGGAVPLHRARRAPRRIRRRTRASAGQRAADGLELRAPSHGERTRPRLAGEVRAIRARCRRGGQSRPGASGTPARRHRCRVQAAVSRHAEYGRGRSPPVASRDGDLSSHGQRHPARGGLQGTLRAPARGARLRARGRADAALRSDAGERSDGARAGADRRVTARAGC